MSEVLSRYQSMSDWKTKQFDSNRASQTPGSIKNKNCQSTPLDRYMCRRNRSHKHRDYSMWCKRARG